MTRRTSEHPITSLDLRLNSAPGGASELRNWRWLREGWSNAVGWEPLIPRDSFVVANADLEAALSPCRHLSIWHRHQGAEVYYLQERAGDLFFEYGNIGTASSRRVTLATGRHEPKPDEPGTQLVPFGRNALLCNGHDVPLWWKGRGSVRSFGWNLPPAAPVTMQPVPTQITYTVATGNYSKSGVELEAEQSCVVFGTEEFLGVGDDGQGTTTRRGYRFAYRSDTGSVSPWSAPTYVDWDIPVTGALTDNRGAHGVVIDDMPIGPAGTVSRLVYATKNIRDGQTGSEAWYVLREVRENVSKQFIDVIPDHLLVEEVTGADSVGIERGFTVGAAWNGHLWLAGGQSQSTLLRYSKQQAPEQFPRDNYFELGTRQGGAVTALLPFYDVLLVFRERSIDVVRTVDGLNYTATTLSSDTGTTAANTITTVPGVGVLFLAPGGVYRITGGLTGGAVYQVKRISDPLEPELRRLSVSAMARATAAYSPREREWWVHFPVDGATENSRGLVLHLEVGGWSRRAGGMDFTQIAVNPRGWFILGTLPEYNVATPTSSTGAPGFDLQVWSAKASAGTLLSLTSTVEGVHTFAIADAGALTSEVASAWHAFGDDSTYTQVMSVELQGLAQGNAELTIDTATNWSPVWTAGSGRVQQPGDSALTTAAPHTYGPDLTGTPATWGSSTWTGDMVTRTRFDVAPQWLRGFRWRLATANPVHVIGYHLEVNRTSAKTTGGRT